MSGVVWRQTGTSVVIGGDAGRLLASASLLAAFASEGMERYNRRMQRAQDLIAKHEAGEELDEVDSEFLDKFLADLAAYDAAATASAETGLRRRAEKRHSAQMREASAEIDREFKKWQKAREVERAAQSSIPTPELKVARGQALFFFVCGFAAVFAGQILFDMPAELVFVGK